MWEDALFISLERVETGNFQVLIFLVFFFFLTQEAEAQYEEQIGKIIMETQELKWQKVSIFSPLISILFYVFYSLIVKLIFKFPKHIWGIVLHFRESQENSN